MESINNVTGNEWHIWSNNNERSTSKKNYSQLKNSQYWPTEYEDKKLKHKNVLKEKVGLPSTTKTRNQAKN